MIQVCIYSNQISWRVVGLATSGVENTEYVCRAGDLTSGCVQLRWQYRNGNFSDVCQSYDSFGPKGPSWEHSAVPVPTHTKIPSHNNCIRSKHTPRLADDRFGVYVARWLAGSHRQVGKEAWLIPLLIEQSLPERLYWPAFHVPHYLPSFDPYSCVRGKTPPLLPLVGFYDNCKQPSQVNNALIDNLSCRGGSQWSWLPRSVGSSLASGLNRWRPWNQSGLWWLTHALVDACILAIWQWRDWICQKKQNVPAPKNGKSNFKLFKITIS